MSQDEINVSDEDETVVDSEEAESVTETDSDQSDSESYASSDVSSDPASPDDNEEYGYDSGDEEEEWTLFRDWTIRLTQEPGDVPQRVIKETKHAGRRFYLLCCVASLQLQDRIQQELGLGTDINEKIWLPRSEVIQQ
ncbi:Crystallin, lambda 1 [Branchiostoma belcheri]|nr:Crystallin, lambda 1 [Branchiostoma belcheri]